MSHDQRPGRMRVVAQSAAERRASDAAAAAGNAPGGLAVQGPGGALQAGAPGAGTVASPTAKLVLGAMFLIGCAVGGVTIAMMAF